MRIVYLSGFADDILFRRRFLRGWLFVNRPGLLAGGFVVVCARVGFQSLGSLAVIETQAIGLPGPLALSDDSRGWTRPGERLAVAWDRAMRACYPGAGDTGRVTLVEQGYNLLLQQMVELLRLQAIPRQHNLEANAPARRVVRSGAPTTTGRFCNSLSLPVILAARSRNSVGSPPM